MAIPWLIGAAVVGLVAAIASSDSSEQEKERRRLEAEADAKRQQARQEEAWRQKKARQVSAEHKIQALMNKYNIDDISPNQAAHLAIHNASACEDLLQKAHINSKTYTDARNKIFAHEQTLKEIDRLADQLA